MQPNTRTSNTTAHISDEKLFEKAYVFHEHLLSIANVDFVGQPSA